MQMRFEFISVRRPIGCFGSLGMAVSVNDYWLLVGFSLSTPICLCVCGFWFACHAINTGKSVYLASLIRALGAFLISKLAACKVAYPCFLSRYCIDQGDVLCFT
jgi:hypothetical protein